VIQQIAIGGTHSEGDFRRPWSGAFVVGDNTPGVPLRYTPGSNSGAPSGCFPLTGSGKDTLRIPRCSAPGSSSDAICECFALTGSGKNTPRVPLRSTPGFNSGAPSGCSRRVRIGSPIDAACYRASAETTALVVSAPEARRNTARSAAAAKLRGMRPTSFSNPCQGVTENWRRGNDDGRADSACRHGGNLK
jgi:hypothetical protein